MPCVLRLRAAYQLSDFHLLILANAPWFHVHNYVRSFVLVLCVIAAHSERVTCCFDSLKDSSPSI